MTPRQDVCIDYDKIPVYATISIRKSEISRIDMAYTRGFFLLNRKLHRNFLLSKKATCYET